MRLPNYQLRKRRQKGVLYFLGRLLAVGQAHKVPVRTATYNSQQSSAGQEHNAPVECLIVGMHVVAEPHGSQLL
jgi:hypothetical protein